MSLVPDTVTTAIAITAPGGPEVLRPTTPAGAPAGGGRSADLP